MKGVGLIQTLIYIKTQRGNKKQRLKSFIVYNTLKLNFKDHKHPFCKEDKMIHLIMIARRYYFKSELILIGKGLSLSVVVVQC